MTPTFCTDQDLLHWEPNLLREATFSSQTLLTGAGDLLGALFVATSGSFVDAHVEPRQVIILTGPVQGCFPIVSVDAPNRLTLSALYDGLEPGDGDAPTPTPLGSATNLAFTIRTFAPQRRLVTEFILQSIGLDPGSALPQPTILNPNCLKRVCALGTLQLIYSALAAVAEEPAPLHVRADLYEHLFRRALRNTTVELDTDQDGQANLTRSLNQLHLARQ